MTDTTALLVQLRALLALTQTEEQIARIRVGQARTAAVRRELEQNAQHAAERSTAIADQLRELGGVADVVTPALGRLGALVKGALEQAEPIDEALLQDLQLEHQLLDRATYLKVLADTAGKPEVKALAERLVTAHSATVEWLTVVLAEQALGGPAALVATPLQRVAGGATKLANLPVRFAADTVNRAVGTAQHAVGTAQHAGEQAGGTVNGVVGGAVHKAGAFTGAVRETLAVGRLASLRRAERIAEREGDTAAAEAVAATRRELGDLTADELPITGYDSMSTAQIAGAVKELDDPQQVNAIIRYEEAHKARSSVVSVVQTRLAALAKEAVGVPE
ncbi:MULTISPECIES: ferritin-like domain-containing protein [unclassified Modestobacter]|uniref:ferritin-like domain-containing protein n=1 Tax=unclassified Modestobacter TaxID=2643866 RepID=UPI0022AB40D0|nr:MULTISPECIES: ferritin-like domain-containing protein [unclassified Modestobacter]MCZ2826596.1 ferritin-like domain-containing protein [Modestobacter sp. VKM Ac-2981]MCZ2854976.1 ferritin-like domain-containing protein [Modestobacter sp. VKM Ac-2982]